MISLWPKVQDDELHSSFYIYMLLLCCFEVDIFCDVFLFQAIVNCKSALSGEMDNMGLCAVIH